MRRLLSGCGHTFEGVSSRNELCPCGSGRKYKRCCLDRLGVVARELRERDELLGDVTAWLREEHEQTIQEAGRETTVVRMLGGRTGRGMSTIWALNDYVPADGGPALMARYAERPELDEPARSLARGLAEARLAVYRVRSTVPDVGVEIEPLADGMPVLLAWRDGLEHLQIGEILVARVVHATAMPTVWGRCARFPAETERRWKARLAALPIDPAQAALTVLGFQPEDAAEPLGDEIALHSMTWSIEDEGAVLETLEGEDVWESIGEAIPGGWAFAWPQEVSRGGTDLGGCSEFPDAIEVARLIVDERTLTVFSAERGTLAEIAAHLQASLRGLIASDSDALAA